MSTFSLPNGTTPDEILASASSSVPAFPIMILVFTWLVIFIRGVTKQSDVSRYADAPQWAVIASMSCLLLSLVMTVKEGFITLEVLLVVVGVTVLSGIWFFLSRGRYE